MQIWKFEIPLDNTFIVDMPKGARVLSAGAQGPGIFIWALVDPRMPTAPRRFPVYGTGQDIDKGDEHWCLVNTVFMGHLVFHVFNAGKVCLR